jgi:hypothetical protein
MLISAARVRILAASQGTSDKWLNGQIAKWLASETHAVACKQFNNLAI